MFKNDIEKLLLKSLQGAQVNLLEIDKNDHQQKIIEFLIDGIKTPREVKRLIGSFNIVNSALEGEVCSFDTLAYCWIMTKAPDIRQSISENVELIVDDPSDMSFLTSDLFLNNSSGPRKPLEPHRVLGTDNAEFDGVLEILFPRLNKSNTRSIANDSGKQVSKKRNLIRLLYLGNPPSLISRKMIEEIWMNSSASEIASELNRMYEEDALGEFIQRLGDFSEELVWPSGNQFSFWKGLSLFLSRDRNWNKQNSLGTEVWDFETWAKDALTFKGIVDDVVEILISISKVSKSNRYLVAKLLKEWINQGDLMITPTMVRKMAVHFGVLKTSTRKSKDTLILHQQEFENLLDQEVKRYKSAIEGNKILNVLPTIQPFFLLHNLNYWDDALQDFLTEYLRTKTAILNFSSLITPPGYIVDQNTLSQLFDVTTVLSRIEGFGNDREWTGSEFQLLCFRRFKSAMKGQDYYLSYENEA